MFLKKFIESLKDPKKPLLYPIIWLLQKAGFLLPSNIKARLGYIFLHELITFFVITQYIELYVVRSNVDLVLMNLKISVASIICIIKSNMFIFFQRKWKDVLDYVTEADLWERNTQDTIRGNIVNRYTSYCHSLLNFYWGLVIITVLGIFLTPLLKYSSSASYREAIRNGTELFPHISSSWLPFDKYRSPGCWIAVFIHIIFCTLGSVLLAAFDTCAIIVLVFLGGKMDLIKERCKQIFDDVTGEEEVIKRMKKIHEDHVMLIKYSRMFDSVLSPVMFCYLIICSFMLCISAFELTTATTTAQLVLTAEYLIFNVAQLFMFCKHSNDIIVKGSNVSNGPYESKWYSANMKHKKYIVTLAGQLRIVHIFKAGPFTDLTLNTFITILKGAYSYYTVLK